MKSQFTRPIINPFFVHMHSQIRSIYLTLFVIGTCLHAAHIPLPSSSDRMANLAAQLSWISQGTYNTT